MHLEGCAHARVSLHQILTPNPLRCSNVASFVEHVGCSTSGAVTLSMSGKFAAHHTLLHTVCHSGENTIVASRAALPNKALQFCQPLAWDCAQHASRVSDAGLTYLLPAATQRHFCLQISAMSFVAMAGRKMSLPSAACSDP